MLAELIKKLRKFRPVPEDSIPFRVAVMCTVLSGILAVLSREEWPSLGIPVVLFTLLGYYVSYIRRAERNTALKVLLSILMIYSFVNFLRDLRTTPYDPRIPLATLLLWLQTLHSFDLPSRRDLSYSLMVGLVLIGVASVLSIDGGIVIYYAAFILSGSVALFHSNLSRLNTLAQEKKDLEPPLIFRHAAYSAGVMVVLSLTAILFIPRFEGMVFRPLPRSWVIRLPSITKGLIVNPGQEAGDDLKKKGGRELKWREDSYFGFNNFVNLNFRGALSDEVVMKVQSNRWTYLRGLVFDEYNGGGWEISGDPGDVRELKFADPPLRLQLDDDTLRLLKQADEIVQIYNIRSELPNIIFGAYHPHLLFFPSETIYRDHNGGLRSPYLLEKGMVYSTVSMQVPMLPENVRKIEEMHRAGIDWDVQLGNRKRYYENLKRKYTRLPGDFPRKVSDLAAEVIRTRLGENPSDFRKAFVISTYLRENFKYDLTVPPFPDSRDSVEYFLFEEKRGYCEHFASAFVTMMRSQGIPARFVTGYLPGDYNPVSGFYSVKMSDAHAWAEVYIPGFGWHTVDPTPGFSSGARQDRGSKTRWLYRELLEWMKTRLGLEKMNIPFLTGEGSPLKAWMVLGSLAVAGGVCVIVMISFLSYRKQKKKEKDGKKDTFLAWLYRNTRSTISSLAVRMGAYRTMPVEHRAVLLFREMLKELGGRGFAKPGAQTAREFLAGSVPLELFQVAKKIVMAFEEARFSPAPPGTDEMAALEDAWRHLRVKIRHYRKPKVSAVPPPGAAVQKTRERA